MPPLLFFTCFVFQMGYDRLKTVLSVERMSTLALNAFVV